MDSAPSVPLPFAFGDALRARLRGVRIARKLSFAEVQARTDIQSGSLVAIERGDAPNVYLHHLHALARAFDLSLAEIVGGWDHLAVGEMPVGGGATLPTIEVVDAAVRKHLREDRGPRTRLAVAHAAGMEPSTLVRWESGEYQRLDVIRLEALARAMDQRLADWLTVRRTSRKPRSRPGVSDV